MKFHNRLLHSSFVAGLLCLLPAVASAQSVFGSDNFDDNSLTVGAGQRWISTYDLSGDTTAGTFTESGGQLSYTSSSEDTQFLRWSGINTYTDNDFDRDWEISIDVTNIANPANGYVTAGLQIYTTYAVGQSLFYNAYYTIMVSSSSGNPGIVTEWAKSNGTTLDAPTTNFISFGDTTDVTLRLSWNSTTNLLTAGYSTNGINFTTGQTFDLAGAEAGYQDPYNQKMGIELFVRSADGAGLVSGGVSFDNMAVSAVPEPSTYAAIAGALMLGFAAWKRRKAKA